MADVVIVIPSYNGVERLEFMLRTMKENDPDIFDIPILVVEDPCGFVGVTEGYVDLSREYGFFFVELSEWSNMHGAASQAFDIARGNYEPKWIIYLGDDLAITPKSLTTFLDFIKNDVPDNVGLVQLAYWNAHELPNFKKRTDFYTKNTDWTRQIPRNPHWEGPSRAYINVNGAGFACRTKMYQKVGGFATGTWCLDESISYKCWMETDYGIVTCPGPPVVHYFGASSLADTPKGDLYDEKYWIEDMKCTKEEADKQMRARMNEWNVQT